MFLNPSSPPQSQDWNSVAVRLFSAVEYREWREAPWLRVCMTDNDEPGRLQAYRLVEAPYEQQLDLAVEQWLSVGELPTLPHPAGYLLALRFVTVGLLLGSFDGVFPPPSAEQVAAIYRTMLLPWWHKHGPSYAVGHSCSGYDVYHKPDAPW